MCSLFTMAIMTEEAQHKKSYLDSGHPVSDCRELEEAERWRKAHPLGVLSIPNCSGSLQPWHHWILGEKKYTRCDEKFPRLFLL